MENIWKKCILLTMIEKTQDKQLRLCNFEPPSPSKVQCARKGTGQLVPKSTRTLVNSYPCLVNSYLSQLVPKSTRNLVYL